MHRFRYAHQSSLDAAVDRERAAALRFARARAACDAAERDLARAQRCARDLRVRAAIALAEPASLAPHRLATLLIATDAALALATSRSAEAGAALASAEATSAAVRADFERRRREREALERHRERARVAAQVAADRAEEAACDEAALLGRGARLRATEWDAA